MKPNYTSTESDRARCSIENNYILDNRRGLKFQFPLCGEDTAVGKLYVNGNETQMSLTLWSEGCLKRHHMKCALHCPLVMCVLGCLLCESKPRGQMSKFLPVLCFKARLLPTVLSVYTLVCQSALHVSWRQY